MNITHKTEKELLGLKLSELGSLPIPSWINALMDQVRSELAKNQIPLTPHFWFGTEWFCPDGVAGMALPFYLLHPKLLKLERKYTKHVEGTTEKEFLQLARHELGHVLDNAYRLRKLKVRNEIFGATSTPYPSSYVADPYNKNFVRHISNHYAQAHPEEDWAESFAVWLDSDSNWRIKYANWPALKKLEYINEVMKRLQGKLPASLNRSTPYNIKNDNRTLKQYFLDKQKERKINRKSFYLPRLPKTYRRRQGRELTQIIAANEKLLLGHIAKKTNLQTYKIIPMIKLLKKESKGNFTVSTAKDQRVIKVLSNIVINEENRFKKQGRHRIIM